MASSYLSRVAVDDDTTIPDDAFTDASTGHEGHHTNIGGAVRAIEGYLGIVGVSPTTTPPGGGTVLLSTDAGQSDWAAPPAGTAAATVVELDYTTASAVGASGDFADGDHKHRLPGPIREAIFTFDSVSSPTVGTYKYRVLQAATLLSIRCSLGTVAATGLACIVDVNKNGTSTMSSGKPSITVGQAINTNSQTFSSTALAADDLISVDIDQGSDGAQLMVIVELQDTTPA